MTRTIAPLHSVRIQNFRGIRDLTLKLHPRVTVLFGINASGKTSILDAIFNAGEKRPGCAGEK
ncbi:MAG: AAA family ATPase [Candidatus Schekmanbacteria bacterium]|nr:AAA family ATPase [Candidatus Schekmanbacteria bacterium]